MVDVAIIVLVALIGRYLFEKLNLPGILGMIATGVLLGQSGFDVIDPAIKGMLKEFKTVALIVILIRAGLGISKDTLKRIGGPAIRMGFIPGILEGTAVILVSMPLLGFNVFEAGMLGFIIAAVSPAVVVPSMLVLKEDGFGKKKEVPTLILAGASLDDVIAITLFSVFAGMAGGHATNWTYVLLGVPAGIILGAAIGAAIGLLLTWFFKKYHLRDTMKVILFIIIAVLFYDGAEHEAIKQYVPIAALLGVMAIGFVLLEKYDVLAHRMAAKFNKVWVFSEILLFVYIGTEVQLARIDGSMVGVGLLILAVGLSARSLGVWISLLGSSLSTKEKVFSMIAYFPKATVQAAMGAVPLGMVLQGKLGATSTETAQVILTLAVLSIVVTAPLGAIGIKISGEKLLEKGD